MTATGPIVHHFTAHFVQRWNFVKKNKYNSDPKYPMLPPYHVKSVKGPDATASARTLTKTLLLRHGPDHSPTAFNAQLVRSASQWSQGVELEKSIQNAYIDLIRHATRKSVLYPLIADFIYIENQYFSSKPILLEWHTVTATGDQQQPVENLIGKVNDHWVLISGSCRSDS